MFYITVHYYLPFYMNTMIKFVKFHQSAEAHVSKHQGVFSLCILHSLSEAISL